MGELTLRDIVFRYLNRIQSRGHGQQIDSFSPEELAGMIAVEDSKKHAIKDIVPHVLEWLSVRNLMARIMKR